MRIAILLTLIATFAACAPTEHVLGVEHPTDDVNAVADTCGAEDNQHLLNQPIAGFNADTVGHPVRVLGVNDIMTEDYRPQRLNIFVNEAGIVIKMYCQ